MRTLHYFQFFFFFCPWKRQAPKVAHNRPQTFFHSTGPAAQTSPELIFHIIMSQDSSVSLSVVDTVDNSVCSCYWEQFLEPVGDVDHPKVVWPILDIKVKNIKVKIKNFYILSYTLLNMWDTPLKFLSFEINKLPFDHLCHKCLLHINIVFIFCNHFRPYSQFSLIILEKITLV